MSTLITSMTKTNIPKIPGDLAATTWVGCLGDSITSKAGADPLWADVGYASWIYVLGNGRYRRVPHVGAGGYTTGQILTSLLPGMIARNPKPTYCVVLGGTNDAGATSPAISVATTAANLTTIYKTLRANNIIPVCCTIPPRLDALSELHKINDWIYRHAQANGYPFVDVHAVLTDTATGGYASGLGTVAESPQIHPSAAGAKAIGQAIVTVLDTLVRPMTPPLVTTQADPTNIAVAPLFLAGFTDAGADLLPDNVSSRLGLGVLSGYTTMDITYAADPGNVVGRWLGLALNATSPGTGFNMVFGSNSKPAVTAGDRIAFGLRAKMEGSGAGTNVGIWLSAGGSSASALNGESWLIYAWSQDFGPNTIYGEAIVPPAFTDMRLNITSLGVTGQKLSIGQLTIKNLTTGGIIV